MVFPGIDMLQKLLVEQGNREGNKTACVYVAFVYLNFSKFFFW